LGWFSSNQTGLVFFIKSQWAFYVLFCEQKEGTIITSDSHPPDLTIFAFLKHRFSVVFCFTGRFKTGLGYFLGTKASLQRFETTS